MPRSKDKSSNPELFLKILQNPQENTCVGVSFFNKVVGLRPATLLKKRLQLRCCPVTFREFSRIPFYKSPPVVASQRTIFVEFEHTFSVWATFLSETGCFGDLANNTVLANSSNISK